jgi:hypothetical protein
LFPFALKPRKNLAPRKRRFAVATLEESARRVPSQPFASSAFRKRANGETARRRFYCGVAFIAASLLFYRGRNGKSRKFALFRLFFKKF